MFVQVVRRVGKTWGDHRLILFGFLPKSSKTKAVAAMPSVRHARAVESGDTSARRADLGWFQRSSCCPPSRWPRAGGLHGHWLDDHFVPAGAVHLGVAVSLRATARLRRSFAMPTPSGWSRSCIGCAGSPGARTARLRSSEVSGATLTVTNLGERALTTWPACVPDHPVLIGRAVRRTGGGSSSDDQI
jgi:hypothetical protein